MAKDIEKQDKREVRHSGPEQLVNPENAYLPNVDAYVSDEELLLVADMPGVKKGDVSIEVNESDTLVISGKTSHTEDGDVTLRQFNTGDYYRSFQLSDEYDKEKINAAIDNGVLTVHIPKREEAKPKKIAINA
jgi:HSP20 family molecular chaperone IbpA